MTVIMGILNVTPDSFSDGGSFWHESAAERVEQALARGLELREQGADVVDVGGESTRPGAARVPIADEVGRVIPVIRELVAAGVPVSVDTMNAETALAAAEAGAQVVNDVSGGLADPAMYRAVADSGLGYIASHWRGFSTDMDDLANYGDVVAEVRSELKSRLAEMVVSGIDPARVILDPGLGFAKTAEHNWALLRHLDEFLSLGHPVLIGASRKRFLAPFAPDGAPAADRDAASATVAALAAAAGVWGVRVHDVVTTKAALAVAGAWMIGEQP